MPKLYEFTGDAKLEGVRFLVTAESESEAREKAERGEFEETIESGAAMIDWWIAATAPKTYED